MADKAGKKDEKKIGVFICHCGGNISDFVDVDKVRAELEKEPGVVVAQNNMFTCSDSSQNNIIEAVEENKLDGIVVASCSPKLHQNTFRAVSTRAGMNPYQYTQVNIREQCSWAHTHNTEEATEKAIKLVRAGVARTKLSIPLKSIRVETIPEVLIVGAGVAGLRSAVALSDVGINVHIIDKAPNAGGAITNWGRLFPNERNGSEIIETLLAQIKERDNVTLFTNTELIEKSGNMGDFEVKVLANGNETITFNVGSIIVTTGYDSYKPLKDEFGYGLNGVVTLPQYKELIDNAKDKLIYNGKEVKSVAYIYCVGSREHVKEENAHEYCSRYCCNAAVHSALLTDELNANIKQYHLFRDVRTYGKREMLYDSALKNGSMFLRYDEETPPQVSKTDDGLTVVVADSLTGGEEIAIETDLVVLVTGMVPKRNAALIDILKLPTSQDGFFKEIHPKLRPVETVVDGVFIAGAAQGPKTMDESVISAMAAVSKSAALLLKGYVDLDPLVAKVNTDLCEWCGLCMETCPFDAVEKVTIDGKEVAQIKEVSCKGEGACVPICPKTAIDVDGYTGEQIESMIDAMAAEVA
ncbi:MAG: CoB--CoM heterodisulfide reductase iron-sulfur subunit A family protein [Chloroflexi bacterium]|jgi:heterodisulfide reductase subunit A2|nr:CoB--CoM heterodisulfide reductase iron-sulfur subunit A family protein [Chloroflexota bacterium]MBT7289014.1 CoB--CoM heterodisulfide reductase iron-sulfur subunit A family protein [Chloroflexota bacterium]